MKTKQKSAVVLCSVGQFSDLDSSFWKAKGFENIYWLEIGLKWERFIPEEIEKRADLVNFLYSQSGNSFSIILLGCSARQRLCPRFLDLIGSSNVSAILRLDDATLNLHPHRPLEHLVSRTLAVFPGPVLPLTLGSHRRIYQLCVNLLDQGEPMDLLVTGAKHNVEAAMPLLEQIAPRIYCYGNAKLRLPTVLHWRRFVEDWLERRKGKIPRPFLFSELLARKATFSGAKQLRRLAESGRYKNIIISYAWMDRIRRLVPAAVQKRIRWFCDTHDVQFVRDNSSGKNNGRLLATPESEKCSEIGVLRKYDRVIAISAFDAETLKNQLGKDRVICCPNGFDYALMPPKPIDHERPVFGFIGRDMEANVLALREIFKNWWPAIHARWPHACLRVAGDVCGNEEFLKNAFLRSDIVADNFVADLQGWLAGLDIVLNPVVVHGGINFKAIEAVMGARVLLTNSRGSACLGDPSMAVIAEHGKAAVPVLEKLIADSGRYTRERLESQALAKRYFSDSVAVSDLLGELRKKNSKSAQSRGNGCIRVLLQAGDHHENRRRILPLAKAIRDRGHHPVVLVYSREFVAPYLAQGVDAVALYDFNETIGQKKKRRRAISKIRNLAVRYREFDLDDVADMAQLQNPQEFDKEALSRSLDQITAHIDRCLRMLEHVRPGLMIVWNGYTGYVANVLRHHARSRGISAMFLERSIIPDGVFIDPCGTNGYSELSNLDLCALECTRLRAAARSWTSLLHTHSTQEIAALRACGPWADARRIIFVPLQVEADTNILLHSLNLRKMADLVQEVYNRYGGDDAAIIVRPHPEEIKVDLKMPNLPGVYVTTMGHLEAWLDLSDLVVTINSTVGLTALLHRRPTLSLGYGIYTGKGLTDGVPPDEVALSLFWDVLLTRYTSLPEDSMPDCLAEVLPLRQQTSFETCNRYGINPDQACRVAEKTILQFRAKILEQGVLRLASDLGYKDRFNLDYRKHSHPITVEKLQDLFIKQLNLPSNFPVEIASTEPADAIVSRTATPSNKTAFDRYGWPIAFNI